MASFEEELFESFTVNQKIETQRIMLDMIASEIRLTEDDFWQQVSSLVERIRDISGEMEDRLQAFQDGVLTVQKSCQDKIQDRAVKCYREAVLRVAEIDAGKGTLH